MTLADYNVYNVRPEPSPLRPQLIKSTQQATLYLILRLRGGGPNNPQLAKEKEMGVAPGGLIKQCILSDTAPASIWEATRTICFNVQILSSEVFAEVTGMDPPKTPITAKDYAEKGLPFYKLYNETSTVKGNFDGIKSVTTLDKAMAGDKRGREEHGEPPYKNPIVLLNPDGLSMRFRPVSELERELASIKAVQF